MNTQDQIIKATIHHTRKSKNDFDQIIKETELAGYRYLSHTNIRNIILIDQNDVCYKTNLGTLRNKFYPSIKAALDKTKCFIFQANKIHNNKYDYSNVNYKHGKSKVVIKCQSGHLFEQSPDLHLRGSGCFICNTGYGYKRDKFISLCKQKKIKPFLYIINCFNNTENFYKIGITTRSVKERYRSKLLMPYSFILTQEISGSPEEIYDLEKLLHKLCKSKLYKPLIKFDGSTECFKFN